MMRHNLIQAAQKHQAAWQSELESKGPLVAMPTTQSLQSPHTLHHPPKQQNHNKSSPELRLSGRGMARMCGHQVRYICLTFHSSILRRHNSRLALLFAHHDIMSVTNNHTSSHMPAPQESLLSQQLRQLCRHAMARTAYHYMVHVGTGSAALLSMQHEH
jgi:hypothetical protein